MPGHAQKCKMWNCLNKINIKYANYKLKWSIAKVSKQNLVLQGGSPGLVVLCDDSCLRVHGVKTQRQILDGHCFTLICCKICIVFFKKRPKINEKEARVGPFYRKYVLQL